MPVLNMGAFDNLPGDKAQNFEDLCRSLMRLHYGHAGIFKALANQPGVEFHLQLNEECSLGKPPRWFGWQCKYHQLTQKGYLTAASKNKIEGSLRKTEEILPGITDWILWTPYTLRKKDQDWFYGLSETPGMSLNLWNEGDLDTYLSGPGEMLRKTYFGELVIKPRDLERQHNISAKPIQKRWMVPVHQKVDAEKKVRQMLGESIPWQQLRSLGEQLELVSAVIAEGQSPGIVEVLDPFITKCREFAEILLAFHNTLSSGDLDTIFQSLEEQKSLITPQVRAVPRILRSMNLPIALDATNALDDMRIAQELLNEAEELLKVEMVAVIADAGGGKTQLSAQLSAPQAERPAGILLHGRTLYRGQNLNGLASQIAINGNPIVGIENLIGALDAAAKRAKCRLPLVIDGLNEAEDPKEWKPLLAQLSEIANNFSNVLIVCTLRTGERRRHDRFGTLINQEATRESFANSALPDDVRIVASDGFGSIVDRAIEDYFSFYKINPGSAEIPRRLFNHPLTLRIFCEVKNPDREQEVTVDYFPASLAPLFEEYITHTCERISEYPNLKHSYTANSIEIAIYKLGLALWNTKKRGVDEGTFRALLPDTGFAWDPWESNIINLLAQEGIVFRDQGQEPDKFTISPVFDALGGFIIARSLLIKHKDDHAFDWLMKEETIESFRGSGGHELGSDILLSLVTLTPRFHDTQLWKKVAEPLQRPALFYSVDTEPPLIDIETQDALKDLLLEDDSVRDILFSRLDRIQGAVGHPLNACFVDTVLREMPMAERDLIWSEWVRGNNTDIYNNLLYIKSRWKENINNRPESDRLHAIWVMWLLTSTDRGLRDIATRTLYWFGRGDPEILFEMTINSLEINDPYVPERMLAASYGVAMAYYSGLDKQNFASTSLAKYAKQLFTSLFSINATYETTHLLLREYAARTIELAVLHNPDLLDENEIERCTPPFSDGNIDGWGESDHMKKEYLGGNSPFRMDFYNYTIGSLVPGRRNYDSSHEGYQAISSKILWRVEHLGWSANRFGEIDRKIEDARYRPWDDRPDTKIDRYGKKYSWIAYYEMSGALHDQGVVEDWRERTSDFDIDPSFPDRISFGKVVDLDLLGSQDIETADWISSGEAPDFSPYLQMTSVNQEEGPWVLLDGFITQENKDLRRDSFSFIKSYMVSHHQLNVFVDAISADVRLGSELLQTPSYIYTFAGEIPWCDTFPNNGPAEFQYVVGERKRKSTKTRVDFFLGGTRIASINPESGKRTIYDSAGSESFERLDISERLESGEIEVREETYEEEEALKQYDSIDVFSPVSEYGWEGYQSVTSDSGHAATLSKEISMFLNLVGLPQTFDLYTKDRLRATLNISDKTEGYKNYQTLFFMRKDLLNTYLDKHGLSLVWVIWGERRWVSNHRFRKSHHVAQPDPAYQTYHYIKHLK